MIAPELRAILVCPSCHGDLQDDLENSKLECTGCGLRYPVENGIPVMLIDEAEHPQ
ncbi:MAG: Trm112 family protein [Acidimicrobiia bacterium]|nr:Trm112 family protein [Acidimicrobiia bacterium]